jgi:hypothetical protein
MPAGLDDLTLNLVELVRRYDRNCRCPRCHQQVIHCFECAFCRANLRKLFLQELSKPAAAFSDCRAHPDQPMIALMKTKTRKTTAKAKTKIRPKAKAKPTPKAITKPKLRKKAAASDDPYAKRIFVRFETPELKELVRKAAGVTNVSLSAYIAAAAVKAAKEGFKLEGPWATAREHIPRLNRPRAVDSATAA